MRFFAVFLLLAGLLFAPSAFADDDDTACRGGDTQRCGGEDTDAESTVGDDSRDEEIRNAQSLDSLFAGEADSDDGPQHIFEVGNLEMGDSCDRRSVGRGLDSLQQNLRDCYVRAVEEEKDEAPGGTLRADWKILTTGLVQDVTIAESNADREHLEMCVTEVLEESVMPRTDAECEVSAEFEFSTE